MRETQTNQQEEHIPTVLTRDDFEHFKKQCTKYQALFNLMDWEIYYEFKNLDHDECYAQTNWDIIGHVATIALNTNFLSEKDMKNRNKKKSVELDRVARHEMFHMVVSKLHSMSLRRFLHENDVESEVESLVRTLEGIYSNIKGGKHGKSDSHT